ncbi:MAG: sulfotransferase [Pseudomonadota bacterium]
MALSPLRPNRIRKHLRDIGMATGLLGRQQDFAKFVVLGRGRSGSNFLATSLSNHPNAIAFGEVFNNLARDKGNIHFRQPGYEGSDPALVHQRETQPLAFIDDTLFAPQPRQIQAVGFKLFYYHAQDADWAPIWPHLQALGVRAIHIRRNNLLESLASEQIAQETKTWSTKTGASDGRPAVIELSIEDCAHYFSTIIEHQTRYATFFDDTFEVNYEDMLTDYEGVMTGVQAFLGLPVQTLSSPLKKQAKRAVSETIGNFAELQAHFAATEYARFFDVD